MGRVVSEYRGICRNVTRWVTALVGITVVPTLPAALAQAPETVPCTASINEIIDDQPIWQGTVSLTCGSSVADNFAREQVILGEPFLLGLTLSDGMEDPLGKGEIDFPVQVVMIDPDILRAEAVFRLPRQQISGVPYAQIAAWPTSAVRPCANDRDGCVKYGYALGDFGWLAYECEDPIGSGCFNAVSWNDTLERSQVAEPEEGEALP